MNIKYPSVILKVFYLTIHFVFNIYELIENICKNVITNLTELCHEFTTVNKSVNVTKFERIPKHLTFLLCTEEPSPKDLANIILWCLAARISFVSFYDHKGTLKKYEDKLHQLIEDKKNASDHVIWHTGSNTVYKNGYSGKKLHVKVFSDDNSIVDLTKQLSSVDFGMNHFDNLINKHFEFPDPDMGVCCGKIYSLYGYPPWHIRLTEFFQINTHLNITSDVFVDLLHKYSKCEQRFGK